LRREGGVQQQARGKAGTRGTIPNERRGRGARHARHDGGNDGGKWECNHQNGTVSANATRRKEAGATKLHPAGHRHRTAAATDGDGHRRFFDLIPSETLQFAEQSSPPSSAPWCGKPSFGQQKQKEQQQWWWRSATFAFGEKTGDGKAEPKANTRRAQNGSDREGVREDGTVPAAQAGAEGAAEGRCDGSGQQTAQHLHLERRHGWQSFG